MSDVDPIIGQWYHHFETEQDFEVIALDEDAQIIEIQYFDGDTEEMDWDAWYEQPIETTEPPEGWSGDGREEWSSALGYEEDEDEDPDEEALKDDEDDLSAEEDEE